jgi:hypothetical protein
MKTQQQFININILLWQHVSVLLDHLQASIQFNLFNLFHPFDTNVYRIQDTAIISYT